MIRGGILTAVQLSQYDNIKHKFLRYGWLEEGLFLHTICSFYAGFAVACATAPLDVVKTRLMNFEKGKPQFKGMFDCA